MDPNTIYSSQSLPVHEVARALALMDASHTELVHAVHELASRHGVRAASRLLGVSPMTISRWRHGDTPGRDALRRARSHMAEQGAS